MGDLSKLRKIFMDRNRSAKFSIIIDIIYTLLRN